MVGCLEHVVFHFIYGMSSFPLTNSYFSRWLLHQQADMHGGKNTDDCWITWDVFTNPIDDEGSHPQNCLFP